MKELGTYVYVWFPYFMLCILLIQHKNTFNTETDIIFHIHSILSFAPQDYLSVSNHSSLQAFLIQHVRKWLKNILENNSSSRNLSFLESFHIQGECQTIVPMVTAMKDNQIVILSPLFYYLKDVQQRVPGNAVSSVYIKNLICIG